MDVGSISGRLEANRVGLVLTHAPLITLRRLSQRGVLPACISKVLKMPLCAACAIAEAHRRIWKTFGSVVTTGSKFR